MIRRFTTRGPRDDAGMSLAELIVYVVLTAIVLTMIATIFGRAVDAQKKVRDRSEATATAQAFIDSFRRTGQNSIAMHVFDGGDVLIAQVRKIENEKAPDDTDSGHFECLAWIHDPAAETVRLVSDPAAFPFYDGDPLPAGITVLDRVVAGEGGAFAARNGTEGVNINITVVSELSEPLTSLSTTVVMRPQGTAEGAPNCFK